MRATHVVGLLGGFLLLGSAAAGAQPCPGDLNGDGAVTVDEIIVAVNTALNGCPLPSPTAPALPSATATPSPSPTPTPSERFVDNGNGTVTDRLTALTWAKKSDDGGIHDRDQLYTWTATHPDGRPTGTLFAVYLATLNGGRFGGHRDWRIPTDEESRTLLDVNSAPPGQPLVAPAFNSGCRSGCSVTQCSCTAANSYWTTTAVPQTTDRAWYVSFQNGTTGAALKTQQLYGRAVRGGS